MFGIMGDSPKRAGSLMPPATTRRLPERPVSSTREARIVPPFIPSGAPQPEPIHLEPERVFDLEPEPDFAAAAEEELRLEADALSAPDEWGEDAAEDGEGTVEPAFEADADAVIEELSLQVTALADKEEFPLDAFIVPEQAQHVPTGLEGAPATPPPEPTAASALAERLEKLSHRLRVEESDAIVRRLAGGDRLDALLAGLLAGYLAGKSERD
jgi:hypothetical protein